METNNEIAQHINEALSGYEGAELIANAEEFLATHCARAIHFGVSQEDIILLLAHTAHSIVRNGGNAYKTLAKRHLEHFKMLSPLQSKESTNRNTFEFILIELSVFLEKHKLSEASLAMLLLLEATDLARDEEANLDISEFAYRNLVASQMIMEAHNLNRHFKSLN